MIELHEKKLDGNARNIPRLISRVSNPPAVLSNLHISTKIVPLAGELH